VIFPYFLAYLETTIGDLENIELSMRQYTNNRTKHETKIEEKLAAAYV